MQKTINYFSAAVMAVVLLPALVNGVARADEIDEVRPRGFSDSNRPEMHKLADGTVVMTVNYAEDARGFVSAIHRMLLKKQHKGTFKQTGESWTLTDETAKKVWIIKARHATAKRQNDSRPLLALADLFPKNRTIAFQASHACEQQKNWAKALEYYRKGCDAPLGVTPSEIVAPHATDTEKSQIAANSAYFELMMGHYATAVKLLTQAIAVQPLYTLNYKNRAEAYRKLNKPDLAAADEKKWHEIISSGKGKTGTIGRDQMMKAVGLMLFAMGAYEGAIERSSEALKKDANNAEARITRGQSLVHIGRPAEAVDDYKALVLLSNNNPEIKTALAQVISLSKEPLAPYGDLSLLKEAPDDLHSSFFTIQNGKRVRLSAAQIAENHKGDWRVYGTICNALQKNGRMQELDKEADKMIHIDPYSATAVRYKIEASEGLLHWSEAEKYCSRYLGFLANGIESVANPDFIEYVFTVRSRARRALKNCAGALEDATTLTHLDNSEEALTERGDCYLQCGKYDLAVADYSKALQLAGGKNSGIYKHRARAYQKMKKGDLANQDLSTAASLEATANQSHMKEGEGKDMPASALPD